MTHSKEVILSDNAPKPFGTYSQAIKYGDVLWLSGQLPIDINDPEHLPEDPVEQLKFCFQNIKMICEEAGSSLNQALKINVYYTDQAVSDHLNEVMETFFQPPYPARIRLKVAGLSRNAKVEIDGVFACPQHK